jgi:dTDP-4-amino-4,6-dideoxygalactose transaminase
MIRITKPDLNYEDLPELKKIINSGWLTKGPFLEKFEKVVSKYTGCKHAIGTSSGTTALHLSLVALRIEASDEVIIPDFTFPATANVVEMQGAIPVLIDIDLDTFNIDIQQIRQKISEKTKAIMPVHQFGLAANMDEIREIAEEKDILILEDAACALGSEYKGKICGGFGDAACFSFHPRKIITTGEGGMIGTNNDEIAN